MHSLRVKWLVVVFVAVLSQLSSASTVTRITTFSDGGVLFAADLNAEFNNLVNFANNIDDDNISLSAAINPVKISGVIAGDGLARNGTTGALSVSVDDSTIEIDSDTLLVKDSGITTGKINDSAVTTVKINDLAVTTAKIDANAVTAAKMAVDAVTTNVIKDLAVTTAKLALASVTTQILADLSVTQAKLANRPSNNPAAVGEVAVSASSGLFSTAANNVGVPVTNASVTITTLDRPVMLRFESASINSGSGRILGTDSVGGAFGVNIGFRRDGGTISNTSFVFSSVGGAQQSWPCTSLQSIDYPGSGTFTYTVEVLGGGAASDTVEVFNCKLVAYEL